MSQEWILKTEDIVSEEKPLHTIQLVLSDNGHLVALRNKHSANEINLSCSSLCPQKHKLFQLRFLYSPSDRCPQTSLTQDRWHGAELSFPSSCDPGNGTAS